MSPALKTPSDVLGRSVLEPGDRLLDVGRVPVLVHRPLAGLVAAVDLDLLDDDPAVGVDPDDRGGLESRVGHVSVREANLTLPLQGRDHATLLRAQLQRTEHLVVRVVPSPLLDQLILLVGQLTGVRALGGRLADPPTADLLRLTLVIERLPRGLRGGRRPLRRGGGIVGGIVLRRGLGGGLGLVLLALALLAAIALLLGRLLLRGDLLRGDLVLLLALLRLGAVALVDGLLHRLLVLGLLL